MKKSERKTRKRMRKRERRIEAMRGKGDRDERLGKRIE
jgi:hypothetical protein